MLSNDETRSQYDQFGHRGVNQGAGHSSQNFDFDLGDIFGDFFGGSRGSRSQKNQGTSLRYELEITLEQAYHGEEVPITYETLVSCSPCGGLGAQDKSQIKTCSRCNGQGQVRAQQGFFSVNMTCPDCRGQGREILTPCQTCRGQGSVNQRQTLQVKIPPGIDSGDQIRLSGKGQAGKAGEESGDLYVRIHIKEHARFVRDGLQLYVNVPIDYPTAVLGGFVEVPTLDGVGQIKIPESTKSGAKFAIRGKGMHDNRSGRKGDLICQISLEVPNKLSDKQKKLLKEFGKSLSKKNYKEASWFERIRSTLLDG